MSYNKQFVNLEGSVFIAKHQLKHQPCLQFADSQSVLINAGSSQSFKEDGTKLLYQMADFAFLALNNDIHVDSKQSSWLRSRSRWRFFFLADKPDI